MNTPRAQIEGRLVGAEPIKVWYTGVLLDGTTAITDPLVKGAVVAWVPEATATGKGRGVAVTQPEDGSAGDNVGLVAGVVESFESATGAQWITIIPKVGNTVCNALVKADADPATPTILVAVTSEWWLAAATVATNATTAKEVFDPCARALEDADTSSTAALKPIMWR
jgi:hypothetical protein